MSEPTTQPEMNPKRIWCADHHLCNVLVIVGDIDGRNPIYARPWLTAWQDVASRKIVGWVIRYESPNTDVILQALKRGCETYGIPETVYTDNGKNFDTTVLTGETQSARWRRRNVRIEFDQPRLTNVCTALGVNHIHADPYHGQSKPVERFFATLDDRFSRIWFTYCGRNTAVKPESLAALLESGNAPTLQEFVESFGKWIDIYNKAIES